MSKIEILPVDGIRRFMAYSRLPRVIYRGRSGFAPPLDAERWTVHAHRLNPHFKLVESCAWLARKDGVYVGRIHAQIYKEPIKPVDISSAQFGCLDAIEDEAIVTGLTQAAEAWLRERGAGEVHGPFSPSINSEAGVLVEGFDALPMTFMPWNPPYLPTMLEKLGYQKACDLISYRYKIDDSTRTAKSVILERPEWRERLKVRPIHLKNIEPEVRLLTELFNDAWSGNWGFVPFTYDEFKSVADGLKFVMLQEGGFLIELDGEPQAFGIILPNLHEITSDLDGRLFPLGLPRVVTRLRRHVYKSGRLALFGIRKALHRKAVGGAVLLAFIDECKRRSRESRIEHVEFGWVLEHNMAMRKPIEMAGAEVDKIHRIYKKPLSG